MMTAFTTRATLRRTARLGLAGAALLVAVTGASAENDGLGGFLESIFGGHQQAAPVAQPMPSYAPRPVPAYASRYGQAYAQHRSRSHVRPLLVRLHQAKPKLVVAQAPSKPGKVS